MLLLKNNFIFIDNIMGDILIDKIDEGIFKKYEIRSTNDAKPRIITAQPEYFVK